MMSRLKAYADLRVLVEITGLEPLTPTLPATGTTPGQAGYDENRAVVDVVGGVTVVRVVVKIVARSESSGGVIPSVKFLGDPYLDQRLAGHPESGRLTIELGDHPCRKVDINSSRFFAGAPSPRRIQSGSHVFAGVEPLVKFLSLHKVPPHLLSMVVRK